MADIAISPHTAYKSQAGFFHVFQMRNAWGVYNETGSLICKFPCCVTNATRALDMAKLAADAFETKYQR